MRTLKLIALLAVAPSIVVAQSAVNGSAETKTNAGVRAGGTEANASAETRTEAGVTVGRGEQQQDEQKPQEPKQGGQKQGEQKPQQDAERGGRAEALGHLSAEGRARAEAVFQKADRQDLPEQPIASAMLEAEAKGASEAKVLKAQQGAFARLEAAKSAMVRAGRAEPSDEEVSRGANVIARGATKAQLEGLVKRCPSDRSLVVAFETLSDVMARGVPVGKAVAEIGAKLEARASDEAIRSAGASLAADAAANAHVNHGPVDAGAAAGATTSAGAAVDRVTGTAGAAGGVTGGVTGGLRP